MKPRIVALHGFLGCGRDWDAVRRASQADCDWTCPDLFASGGPDFGAPPTFPEKAWLAGYSFGARLALRWMAKEPSRWNGALLLSCDPGNFQGDEQRIARKEADAAWATAFRAESWDTLMSRWNAQAVFSGRSGPRRAEEDFDRAKLADTLERFSVADQFTDAARLDGAFVWMAGNDDAKFCGLLDKMRISGFPGSFFPVPGAGHRLLHDAPHDVAAALDRLVAKR